MRQDGGYDPKVSGELSIRLSYTWNHLNNGNCLLGASTLLHLQDHLPQKLNWAAASVKGVAQGGPRILRVKRASELGINPVPGFHQVDPHAALQQEARMLSRSSCWGSSALQVSTNATLNCGLFNKSRLYKLEFSTIQNDNLHIVIPKTNNLFCLTVHQSSHWLKSLLQ